MGAMGDAESESLSEPEEDSQEESEEEDEKECSLSSGGVVEGARDILTVRSPV